MIKYHDNRHGTQYDPETHKLTDNWNPAEQKSGVYINAHFRISYPAYDICCGGWKSQEDRDTFFSSAREVLHDFSINEECGYKPKEIEHLYLHPQDISGCVEAIKVKPLAEALNSAGLTVRWVDLYDEVSTMTNEEFVEHLNSEREEIRAELLDGFKTKRSNLYHVPSFMGGCIGKIIEKHSIARKGVEHASDDYLCNNYIWEVLRELVADGKIVEAETKNGTGYRTAKNVV